MPDRWEPDEAGQAFAVQLGLDPGAVLAQFRDWWAAKPGQGGVKLDWPATWRVWCRTEAGRRTATRRPEKPAMYDRLARIVGLEDEPAFVPAGRLQ